MIRLVSLLVAASLSLSACGSNEKEQNGNVADGDASATLSERERRELDRIATLGYLSGGAPAPDVSGVTASSVGASPGYTICVSSDFAGAYLLDMDGRILHAWVDKSGKAWNRARPRPDGRIVGIQEFPGQLVELSPRSRVLRVAGNDIDRFTAAARLIRAGEDDLGNLIVHHDFVITEPRNGWVIARTWGLLPSLRGKPFVKDVLCRLVAEADSIRMADSLSVPGAFLRSDYSGVFTAAMRSGDRDPTHANSIEILKGSIPHPAFVAGNILVSLRNMSCLAVIDPRLREVVWVSQGPWQRQHCARETPDGTILLFDNRPEDGQSRVAEYDPIGDRVVWEFSEPGFFTEFEGAEQLLPNGNLLVTESRDGRILEVSEDGGVVWEYVTPGRSSGGDSVAVIYRAYRVPYDYFVGEFGEELRERRLSKRFDAEDAQG